jgi:hypothetical protein
MHGSEHRADKSTHRVEPREIRAEQFTRPGATSFLKKE